MEKRTIWTVHTNTDLTEGRGRQYISAYCEFESTARRLAKKNYVMGHDCPVIKGEAWYHDGKWYTEMHLQEPSAEDLEIQNKVTKREAIIQRAKDLGFTAEEIELLQTTN